jgi:hypothetical protein
MIFDEHRSICAQSPPRFCTAHQQGVSSPDLHISHGTSTYVDSVAVLGLWRALLLTGRYALRVTMRYSIFGSVVLIRETFIHIYIYPAHRFSSSRKENPAPMRRALMHAEIQGMPKPGKYQ